MKFEDLKKEIVKRAEASNACLPQKTRAYEANGWAELMQVIKDNFDYAARNKVIDADLIEEYKEQFDAHQIYCNVNVTNGFLLACGNSAVRACGNSYITSYSVIECKLHDNAIYRARKSNTVRFASDEIKFKKV
jgi:hypothetical protein